MIVRRGDARDDQAAEGRPAEHGALECLRYSDAGGLTQFGAYLETLQPGSRSSVRHWHEQCDELVFLIAGEATVVENDGEHVLLPGDAACWPAGAPNAHHVLNRSAAPCSYLIVGTRVKDDICHYPDVGRVLHTEGENWRLVESDGTVIKSGKV